MTKATLDDLHEAVTTLEETAQTARRVLGGAHPIVVGIEADLLRSRAALAAVQNLSAPTPTKSSKAKCLHGNGPECGSCAEIFAAPPSPLN